MKEPIAAKLANALGRRDEELNIQLASELAQTKSVGGIAELAELLRSGSGPEKNDAIKVLYEVGARSPSLLLPHTSLFLEQMNSKNNRMVWGALTALAEVVKVDPKTISANLSDILAAADAGSVIAKDQAVQILIALKAQTTSASDATKYLFERLESAAVNQLPMYAERISVVLEPADRAQFREILSTRLQEHMPESKRKRIKKVMAK